MNWPLTPIVQGAASFNPCLSDQILLLDQSGFKIYIFNILSNTIISVQAAKVLLQYGGFQISNGSLLQTVQKNCLLLFFLVCPWPDPSFCDTKFESCYAHFGCVIDTKRDIIWLPPSVHFKPKVCIIGHKICVWAASSLVW